MPMRTPSSTVTPCRLTWNTVETGLRHFQPAPASAFRAETWKLAQLDMLASPTMLMRITHS